MTCGIGYRHGSDPTLLWLWHKLVATASIIPLAWEPSYAVSAALEKKKRIDIISFLGLSACRLGDCGLTAADSQDLASALTKNQSLTHLYLASNSLGSEGVNLLGRAMKLPNCSLQRLM